MLARYKALLQVRRESVLPLLDGILGNAGTFQVLGASAVVVKWALEDGRVLRLDANLCDREKEDFPPAGGRILWHEGPEPEGSRYGPWTVRWVLQEAS